MQSDAIRLDLYDFVRWGGYCATEKLWGFWGELDSDAATCWDIVLCV
jgi:hypothetical protein